MITKKYYKLIRVSHADEGYFYIKNVSNEVGEFKMNGGSGTMEYSLDGVTWTSYNLSTKPTVNVNPNSNIYLRGTGFKFQSSNISLFNFNKNYNIGGNFMSVSNYATMSSVTEINSTNIIIGAFFNQTNLVSANDMILGSVTTVGQSGLSAFFYGCTSLTTPPDLSGVTTVGLSGMSMIFNGCTSLTTPPDLSSVTTVGQSGMSNSFYGCTSLTTPPDLSGVTTVGQQSFDTCFRGCTSLTTGPDFSKITTVGSQTFKTCFFGCSKLSTVTAPNIQDLTQNSVLQNWLQSAGGHVTGTKTVNVPTVATISSGDSGIPTGWTRVDY